MRISGPMTYSILERVLYQLFGECSAVQEYGGGGIWLYLRNGYSFFIEPIKFFSVEETMDELREIHLSLEIFEDGGVIYS